MKIKTTKKEIKSRYNVYIVDCEVKELLENATGGASYYCTRAEGWACDFYIWGGVAYCIGYAPVGRSVPLALRNKYRAKADKIKNDKRIKHWTTKKERYIKLLNEFTDEVIK